MTEKAEKAPRKCSTCGRPEDQWDMYPCVIVSPWAEFAPGIPMPLPEKLPEHTADVQEAHP